MFKRYFSLLCVSTAVLLCAGCAKEPGVGNESGKNDSVSSKILGTPSASDGTSLLVYVKDGSDEEVASLCEECGASSYGKVFQSTPGKEELERSCGLDRWYRFNFEEGAEISEKAMSIAASSAVRTVQYNARLVRNYVGKPRQFVPETSGAIAPQSIAKAQFNDPYLKNQWHYDNNGAYSYNGSRVVESYAGADVNVKQAWTLCAGSPDVVVAVIDECVQWDHPDLAANMWNNPRASEKRGTYVNDAHGWNFVKNTATLNYKRLGNVGHGTHVAGTVAAVNNNGVGVGGVAGGSGNGDGVKIMTCQIFDGFDGCDAAQLGNAFKYAADNGACIAQCSFGYESGSFKNDNAYYASNAAEVDAIRYFIKSSNCSALDGGLVIVAAGNDGESPCAYPAALKECIGVTAFGIDGLPAYYTNYGPGCNISAPGGEYYTGGQDRDCTCILSTMPTYALQDYDDNGHATGEYLATNYGWMQGTSMSCPHASGVAALGLSYALKTGKHFTNDEFKSMFLTSVSDIDTHIGKVGTKKTLVGSYFGTLRLSPYKGQMGTGMVDAWNLYMQIDGTPSFVVATGVANSVDVSSVFGGNSANLTYKSVEVLDDGESVLGLAEAPSMKYGKLQICPTKTGCARLRITALSGGSDSTSPSRPSGTAFSKVVSVVAKSEVADNGAWL